MSFEKLTVKRNGRKKYSKQFLKKSYRELVKKQQYKNKYNHKPGYFPKTLLQHFFLF